MLKPNEPDFIEGFDWGLYPEVEKFLEDQVKYFLGRHGIAKNMAARMRELKDGKIPNPKIRAGGQNAIDHEIGMILRNFDDFVKSEDPKLLRFAMDVIDSVSLPPPGKGPYRDGDLEADSGVYRK